MPEHTHIPLSRRTPFPGGGELPKRYSHTHDPFVGLAFAAAATKKLLLGTGICLVPQHDPIVTAKAIASLDQLSGGRFVFGIGAGWNADEMENHGVRYETRFKVMREHVLAMKALWTAEEASFHGEFVKFDPVWSWPKPAAAPASADHSGRRERPYAAPRDRAIATAGSPARAAASTSSRGSSGCVAMATEKGRNPSTLTTIVFGAANDAKVLEGYEKAGIQSALLAVPDEGRDEILRYLDKIAPLAKLGVPA